MAPKSAENPETLERQLCRGDFGKYQGISFSEVFMFGFTCYRQVWKLTFCACSNPKNVLHKVIIENGGQMPGIIKTKGSSITYSDFSQALVEVTLAPPIC